MNADAGLYLHIPFCRHLCPYCDFAVAVRRDPPFAKYISALIDELGTRWEAYGSFGTVYLGGGTPGLTPVAELERLLQFVGDRVESPREVTLEANPNDVCLERVAAWQEMGITRLSIGVQSFDDAYLQRLGRDHSGEQAHRAVECALSEGLEVSVDLIWGGPGHEESTLERDLDRIAGLGVGHVSGYELTVEPNTAFGRRERAGTLDRPPEETLERYADRVVEGLAARGYHRYEVSSYARSESHRADHNSGYWLGRPYLGAGTGAHSFRRTAERILRWKNHRSLRRYLDSPTRVEEFEELSAREHLRERLFLAARTKLGVSLDELRQNFGQLDDSIWESVARWHEHGVHLRLLEDDSLLIRATSEGLNLADVSAELVWDYV